MVKRLSEEQNKSIRARQWGPYSGKTRIRIRVSVAWCKRKDRAISMGMYRNALLMRGTVKDQCRFESCHPYSLPTFNARWNPAYRDQDSLCCENQTVSNQFRAISVTVAHWTSTPRAWFRLPHGALFHHATYGSEIRMWAFVLSLY